MESQNFLGELKENGVLIIRINREKKMNALTFEMFAEMRQLVDKFLDSDKDIRVIVMTQVGKHFSAGLDLMSAMSMG